MSTIQLPLFPLHTVLLPGGPLPLRIFEARYLDMVSQCLQTDSGFGVCMIEHGKEVGEPASTVKMGVLARIVDWHQRSDGLLGITVMGTQRFILSSVEVQSNKLSMATVELLDDKTHVAMPERFLSLVDVLKRLLDGAGPVYADLPRQFNDAGWVSFRLVELLPIEMKQKQLFLEMDDPVERLELIYQMLEGMQVV
jgi:Lon protease-like protein